MPYLTLQRHLVKVRDLRAHLREIMEGDEPRIIGTEHTARAFLIPLLKNRLYYGENLRQVVAKARKDFAELIQCLEGL